MFASLKNKIKEETGSDLSKITAKITSSTVQKFDSLRGRSHQGSSSSINSLVSLDGVREDGTIEPEEFRRRLGKIEVDFARRLECKEQEWRHLLLEKDKQLQSLKREKDDALDEVISLRGSLKSSEEFKQKLVEHREDNEQIENLQIQELSKVKNLVLQRDRELAEKSSALKEAFSQLEKLRSEVSRLRRQEEQLSDVQDDLESLRHSSARDLKALAIQLAKSEEEKRHLEDLVMVFRQQHIPGDEKAVSERKLLEQRLEEAHLQLSDIKTSWSNKIASLETQVERLSRQAANESSERRRAVSDKEDVMERLKQAEAELEYNKMELNNKGTKINLLESDVKELSKELRNLKAENEEEVSFLRTQLQNVSTEVKAVRKNLENTESELDKTEEECCKLKISADFEHEANSSLKQMITKLEKELTEERTNSLNVQKTLSRVTTEKNTALLRNAEISQQMEMVKQEKRRQEGDVNDLLAKLSQLEDENNQQRESKSSEQQLRNTINDLEEQLSDKTKNIKTLQLRLADLKKTLQQELRTPGNPNYHTDLMEGSGVAILAPSQVTTRGFPNVVRRDDDDVNFKYLKHVVIKFLTSREYEAQHLIKAMATVLKFTPDEEKLISETLEYKKSWFGSRPKVSASKARNVHS